MHIFAQCTVIWKIFQNSHSHISQSQWRNCENIIDAGFLNYVKYATQLFCKLLLASLARIRILNITSFIENYRHMISKTISWNYLPFTHIFVYSLCQFSDTGIIMTSEKRCHVRESQNHTWIFLQCTIGHRPLWKFARRFRLRNVSKGIISYKNRN